MMFRIEIATGMATGKTTLCKALAPLGFNPVLEDLKQNPFLDDFYGDMGRYAFPFQLSFVSSKFRDVAHADPQQLNIFDYSVANGRAYSSLAFKDSEPAALEAIVKGYDYLEHKLGAPALILYINCPVEIQIERICQRNRSTESNVPAEYLTSFNTALLSILDIEREKGRKILTVQDNAVTGLSWDDHVRAIAQMIKQELPQKSYAAPTYYQSPQP